MSELDPRMNKILDFFISKCCKAPYDSVLKDNGQLGLKCTKCGKHCGVLEEKFTKGKWPDCYN